MHFPQAGCQPLTYRCIFLLHGLQLGAATFGCGHPLPFFWPLVFECVCTCSCNKGSSWHFLLPCDSACWLLGSPCRWAHAGEGHSTPRGSSPQGMQMCPLTGFIPREQGPDLTRGWEGWDRCLCLFHSCSLLVMPSGEPRL